MAKHILIIGPPGSGKTYISGSLKKKGVNSYDADLVYGLSSWFGINGEKVTYRQDNEFLDNHRFLWDRDFLSTFLSKQEDDIYLFGISDNIFDMVNLFDKVYFLKTPSEIITKRLNNKDRKNPMGGTNYQVRKILELAEDVEKKAGHLKIKIIDANQAPEKILLEING